MSDSQPPPSNAPSRKGTRLAGSDPRAGGDPVEGGDPTGEVQSAEGLRASVRAVERVEEAERRRLAGDLHDSVGQLLPLVVMKLDGLVEDVREDPDGLEDRVAEIRSLLVEAEQQIRTLIFQLSPVAGSGVALRSAIDQLAGILRQRYGLAIEVESEGPVPPLDDERAGVLLRGLRELLINVARHAGTDAAHVAIAHADGTLAVSVADRGAGLAQATGVAEGFGLATLRDRLARLGGRLEIETTARGTSVRMRMPTRGERGWRTAPLARDRAGASQSAAEPASPGRATQRRPTRGPGAPGREDD